MKRSVNMTVGWAGSIALAIGFLLCGCSNHPCNPCSRHSHLAAPPAALIAVSAYAPALLFDRQPGYPPAAFAHRSDWPSTQTFYATGQQVFYREHFVDYQGPGFPHHFPGDWTYLHLDSVRIGGGFR